MEDITLIASICVIFYLLPILISIHLIKEFKLYVVSGSMIFIPILNILEMIEYLGEAVEKISKEAKRKEKTMIEITEWKNIRDEKPKKDGVYLIWEGYFVEFAVYRAYEDKWFINGKPILNNVNYWAYALKGPKGVK